MASRKLTEWEELEDMTELDALRSFLEQPPSIMVGFKMVKNEMSKDKNGKMELQESSQEEREEEELKHLENFKEQDEIEEKKVKKIMKTAEDANTSDDDDMEKPEKRKIQLKEKIENTSDDDIVQSEDEKEERIPEEGSCKRKHETTLLEKKNKNNKFKVDSTKVILSNGIAEKEKATSTEESNIDEDNQSFEECKEKAKHG